MNYTIKSKLGEGGMTTVYLAEDHKFHTEVALNVLNKEFVHNENIRKRVLAEARYPYPSDQPHLEW
jgi:serine/threonine-protein kinase